MKNLIIINIALVVVMLSLTSLTHAFEVAPGISDREIVEWLTRIEVEIRANSEAVKQLRDGMNLQFGRIDSQFSRLTNIILAIFGAFVALVGGIIWFALWDRRSMIRPFEEKTKDMEDEISSNRAKLHLL